MKEYKYTVFFEPAEEGGYILRVPAMPEICTEGDTLEEHGLWLRMPSVASLRATLNWANPSQYNQFPSFYAITNFSTSSRFIFCFACQRL